MIVTLSKVPFLCRYREPEEIKKVQRIEFWQRCLVIAIGFLMAAGAGAVAVAISKLY